MKIHYSPLPHSEIGKGSFNGPRSLLSVGLNNLSIALIPVQRLARKSMGVVENQSEEKVAQFAKKQDPKDLIGKPITEQWKSSHPM